MSAKVTSGPGRVFSARAQNGCQLTAAASGYTAPFYLIPLETTDTLPITRVQRGGGGGGVQMGEDKSDEAGDKIAPPG